MSVRAYALSQVCNKTLEYLNKQKAEAAANLMELTKAIESRA